MIGVHNLFYKTNIDENYKFNLKIFKSKKNLSLLRYKIIL